MPSANYLLANLTQQYSTLNIWLTTLTAILQFGIFLKDKQVCLLLEFCCVLTCGFATTLLHPYRHVPLCHYRNSARGKVINKTYIFHLSHCFISKFSHISLQYIIRICKNTVLCQYYLYWILLPKQTCIHNRFYNV